MSNTFVKIIRHTLTSLMLLGVLAQGAYAQVANPRVVFKTTLGSFTMELYPAKAPITVKNFLEYVKSGHYSGTIFHRVINGFMVQGGGMNRYLEEKPTRAPIPLEARNGLKNDFGMVAMARTGDPDSATAQFYVNVANNDSLNAPSPDGYGYAVFGKIISGMEVIDQIKSVPTTRLGNYSGVPSQPITIESATLVTQ